MAGEHICAVEDCHNLAKPGQLMCWPHWKDLPRALQSAVNKTWARIRYEPEAYREARAAAVDYWRGRSASAAQGSLL